MESISALSSRPLLSSWSSSSWSSSSTSCFPFFQEILFFSCLSICWKATKEEGVRETPKVKRAINQTAQKSSRTNPTMNGRTSSMKWKASLRRHRRRNRCCWKKQESKQIDKQLGSKKQQPTCPQWKRPRKWQRCVIVAVDGNYRPLFLDLSSVLCCFSKQDWSVLR